MKCDFEWFVVRSVIPLECFSFVLAGALLLSPALPYLYHVDVRTSQSLKYTNYRYSKQQADPLDYVGIRIRST